MTSPKKKNNKKKYSKPKKATTKPDTSVQLTSANPDPKSWLYKLVQEYNVIHTLSAPCTDQATLLQGKLDLISETILSQQLLRAFYNAMKDPEERTKCLGKVDGTTPSGLGGKTGLVKNVWTMASLLDAVTDTVGKFARELRDGEVEGWGEVDGETGVEGE